MRYSRPEDEGLGLSLVLFAGAVVVGLGLCVAPVLWANGPSVYANVGDTTQQNSYLQSSSANRNEFPVATLKRQEIVSPAELAKLNEQTKTVSARRHTPAAVHRAYAQVPERAAEAAPPQRSFFSLF